MGGPFFRVYFCKKFVYRANSNENNVNNAFEKVDLVEIKWYNVYKV